MVPDFAMTPRHSSLTTAAKRALRCLSLVILPALASEVARANPVSESFLSPNPIEGPGATSHSGEQVPYLTAVVAVPLRFDHAPKPPDFEVEPIPTGPAMPDDQTLPTIQTPTIQPKPNLIPANPPASSPAAAANGTASSPASNTGPAAKGKNGTPASSSHQDNQNQDQELTPILPDDMHHDVRPEDVIPYFQFPRGGVILNAPVPSQPAQPTLPPSSATYTQQ